MNRQVELQIMPKLYLGPGLSRRVHQALTRRLEQFMAANVAAPAAPAAPAAVGEFPVSENPPLSLQAGAVDTESEKPDDQDAHMHGEDNRSPADKEDKEERDAGRDDDRSRSPRLRMQEPFDPNEATDLLASTTGLAVGITSMVAALKGSTDKLETLIKSTHTLQQDLCRSLEAVGAAVNNMARASESLAAGVNHNTSRVGAVVGEYTKLKKHLEWCMDVSMGDVLKKNAKNRTERDQALQDLMTQLFESMDKLQENMQKIAVRIEKAPVGQEGTMDYDPPQPPMGHLGIPSVTPLTPAPGLAVLALGSRLHRRYHPWCHQSPWYHRSHPFLWRSLRATVRLRWGSYRWATLCREKWRISRLHLAKYLRSLRAAFGACHPLVAMTRRRVQRHLPR